MWEFSTDADDTDKLGVAMSSPSIARVKAGNKWVGIFGNGYESGDNVKLMVVDLQTGELIRAIDTGVSGANNGLASPVPVDVNNDRITDYVYAGDLQGNLWRFDLTANATSGWGAGLLFAAVDRDGNPQPITSRPDVGRHPDGGVMVYFGTGKYFQTSDNLASNSPQVQSFYGIRDLHAPLVTRERDNLQPQQIIFEGVGRFADGTDSDYPIRVVSNNGEGLIPSSGWYIDLVAEPGSAGATGCPTCTGSGYGPKGERVVSMPVLRHGRIIFTTIIPYDDPCGYGGESWLMELDAITGGRLPYSVIDVNNDGVINESDYVQVGDSYLPVSGKHSTEMIKTPGIVDAGENEYKYTSGSSGTVGVTREKGGGAGLGRQSWRQLQ
jgi:type IV pilus assembly protein PilY1